MAESKKLSLRERRKRETREDLLEAAGTLFGQKGYNATSIDDIVEEAGASRATLYAHFASKSALLEALLDQMQTEALRYYEQFGELTDWSRRSVLGWVTSFAVAWERDSARNRAASAAYPRAFLEDAPRWHREHVRAVRKNTELWSHFTSQEASVRASMMVHVLEHELSDRFLSDTESSEIDFDVFVGYLCDAIRALLEA